MKISNLGITSRSLAPQQPADANATTRDQGRAAASTEASAYTPSAELTQLMGLVQQQADVRPERVQAAMQRLEQGDYQTPAAADQTAAAMLSTLD